MTEKQKAKQRKLVVKLKKVTRLKVIKFLKQKSKDGKLDKAVIRRLSIRVKVNQTQGEKND